MKIFKKILLVLGSLILPLTNLSIDVKADVVVPILDAKPVGIQFDITYNQQLGKNAYLGYLFNVNSSLDVVQITSVELSYRACNFWFFTCINKSSTKIETMFYDKNVNDIGAFSPDIKQVNNINNLLNYEFRDGIKPIIFDSKDFNTYSYEYIKDNYDYYFIIPDNIAIFEVVQIKITYINSVQEEHENVCVGDGCKLKDNAPPTVNDLFDQFNEWLKGIKSKANNIVWLLIVLVLIIVFKYTLGWLPKLLTFGLKLIPIIVDIVKFIIFLLWELIKIPFKLLSKLLGLNKDKNNYYYVKKTSNKNYKAYYANAKKYYR